MAAAVRSLRTWTAREVNAHLGRTGTVWQRGYYEHLVRDARDHDEQIAYILNNPVRKGLARSVGEYRWARAGPWYAADHL